MTANAHKIGHSPSVLDDIVIRRPQPLSALPTQDPTLNALYLFWQSCRKEGLLPRRKDIDVLQMKPVLGHTHLLDVSSADPRDYRFRLYGSKIRLDRFSNYTNTRIGDLPSQVLRDAVIADYTSVVWSGTPLYQNVVARTQSITYSYSRLLLPLAEDGRNVTMLIICTRDQVFPDFTI